MPNPTTWRTARYTPLSAQERAALQALRSTHGLAWIGRESGISVPSLRDWLDGDRRSNLPRPLMPHLRARLTTFLNAQEPTK